MPWYEAIAEVLDPNEGVVGIGKKKDGFYVVKRGINLRPIDIKKGDKVKVSFLIAPVMGYVMFVLIEGKEDHEHLTKLEEVLKFKVTELL